MRRVIGVLLLCATLFAAWGEQPYRTVLRKADDYFVNAEWRDALAMSVLGESAQELNPFIKEGSASLREYAAEAANTGYIMSTETLESLQAVDDAQQELLATQKKVSNQIAGEYAPYMTEALGNTKDFIDKIGTSLTKSNS